VLPDYPEAVAGHAERALNRARITLFRDNCVEIRSDAVVLASGARLACDVPVIVTGAEAPAWLVGSGLALDGQGFVVTGPTLQSGSHAEVFAVGDVATRIDAPHPRSGVYAVRAGPPLLANLRAYCSGAGGSGSAGRALALNRYLPQTKTLNILSLGARRAIAVRGQWCTEGRWVWLWKNIIDRAFVARYSPDGGGAQAQAQVQVQVQVQAQAQAQAPLAAAAPAMGGGAAASLPAVSPPAGSAGPAGATPPAAPQVTPSAGTR
jgi:NADH dehydrogenase FAD-containing subunit